MIEKQRHHAELCPRLRLTCAPLNPGSKEHLRLRVALVGPAGLDRLDRLTVTVRNDRFLRGEGPYQQHAGGPTPEEIKAHIWGPYRFVPKVGRAGALADSTGRETVYDAELPIGEELPYQLEPTDPAAWMSGTMRDDWRRQQGTIVRLAFKAEHAEHGTWYLPCEIDMENFPVTVMVPQPL